MKMRGVVYIVTHHAKAREDVLARMRRERSQRMRWQGADEPVVEACGVSAANGQMDDGWM